MTAPAAEARVDTAADEYIRVLLAARPLIDKATEAARLAYPLADALPDEWRHTPDVDGALPMLANRAAHSPV